MKGPPDSLGGVAQDIGRAGLAHGVRRAVADLDGVGEDHGDAGGWWREGVGEVAGEGDVAVDQLARRRHG